MDNKEKLKQLFDAGVISKSEYLSMVDQIEVRKQLKEVLDAGIITQEEYDEKIEKLISNPEETNEDNNSSNSELSKDKQKENERSKTAIMIIVFVCFAIILGLTYVLTENSILHDDFLNGIWTATEVEVEGDPNGNDGLMSVSEFNQINNSNFTLSVAFNGESDGKIYYSLGSELLNENIEYVIEGGSLDFETSDGYYWYFWREGETLVTSFEMTDGSEIIIYLYKV